MLTYTNKMEIEMAFKELDKKVFKRGKTHQHNVFIYLSGHAVISTQGLL